MGRSRSLKPVRPNVRLFKRLLAVYRHPLDCKCGKRDCKAIQQSRREWADITRQMLKVNADSTRVSGADRMRRVKARA